MDDVRLTPEVLAYYRQGKEPTRLRDSAQGRLEFLRMRDLLRRHLPGGRLSILDVGGGAGVHAAWLASDGHDVHLVDPMAAHVATASALDGVTAEVGDARRLRFDDDSYDVVLMLGPLYHLRDAADRAAALGHARRIARGAVAAATINRFAGWLDAVQRDVIDPERMRAVLNPLIDTGHLSPAPDNPFTGYFHKPEEIRGEFAAAGFADIRQFGVQGAVWLAPAFDSMMDDDVKRGLLLDALRRTETEPSLWGASNHLLTVARP
ncbi:MAG TPA: methyltransferase domain-containing protein [Stackebrandtia sp.]|jgi:SAM-dependent methyltransferase|uniref:class I SAM-dependent methyltransferase n=1 Tax=Stackebrandtia sp. TaxID=2023065 RepID=UPI002D696E78|nr:methyltransferase domain-containing protein [Stackebrandtia sp.]HZE39411.1 methyltransferase domain-containing protein [Stackebrandtia sp.]